MWNDSVAGGGFGDPSEVESPSKQKPKGQKSQTIIPLMAKQIQGLEDDKFFNQTLTVVKFVGLLKSQEMSSTKVNYELEDFSGQISAILWLEHDAGEEPEPPQLIQNAYVEVYGAVKNQRGRLSLMILSIRPIKNVNQITTHILQAVLARYHYEKNGGEDINPQLSNMSLVNNAMDATLSNSMIAGGGGGSTATGMSALDNSIYKVIRSVNTETGADVEYIASALRMKKDELMRSIDSLVNEGHIYSTIDENHFKATEYN